VRDAHERERNTLSPWIYLIHGRTNAHRVIALGAVLIQIEVLVVADQQGPQFGFLCVVRLAHVVAPIVAPDLDLEPIRAALGRLETAGGAYELALARLDGADAEAVAGRGDDLAELNRLLYTSERALASPVGLPRRDWFKHLVYAPGLYTGYGVKTLPGIREGLEESEWAEAEAFVTHVADALDALADQVNEATALMHRVAG